MQGGGWVALHIFYSSCGWFAAPGSWPLGVSSAEPCAGLGMGLYWELCPKSVCRNSWNLNACSNNLSIGE